MLLSSAARAELVLTEQERQWLADHPVLSVGEALSFPPLLMETGDGRLEGMLVDTFDIIGDRLGVEFVFRGDSWQATLASAQQGDLDIVAAVNRQTGQRLGLLTVDSPYDMTAVLYARRDRSFEATGPESLLGKRVGYHRDKRLVARYLDALEEVHSVAYERAETAFNALINGDVDLVLGLNFDSYLLIKNSILEIEQVAVVDDLPVQSSIAVNANRSQLAHLLEKAVADFTLAERQHIQTRWSWSSAAGRTRLALSDKEREYLAANPTLKVQGLSTFPPFNFTEQGLPAGYTVDYMRRLAELLGVQVEFVGGVPWHETLQMLMDGRLDVIPHIAPLPSREDQLDFTSFNHIQFLTAVAVNRQRPIDHFNELEGKVVAVVRKSFLQEYLSEHYPQLTLFLTDTTREAVAALSQGKVDLVVGNLPTIDYYIHKDWLSNVEINEVKGLKLPGQTALKMGVTQGNSTLLSILQKADEAMPFADRATLSSKWLNAAPLAMAQALTHREREFLAERVALKMCVDPQWLPLEGIEDGQHTGIAADFMARFQQVLATPIEMLETDSWAESLAAARRGECDFFSMIMNTPERADFLSFTQPYVSSPLVFATDVSIPYIGDINAVRGERIGIVEGFAFKDTLQRDYPKIEFVDVKDVADGLDKVASGELFGYADSLISIGYWIQNNYVGQLKVSGEFARNWSLSIGVQRELPILRRIFDKAISQVTMAERRDMVNRWISIRYHTNTNWWVTALIVLAVVAGFSMLILGYRRIIRTLRQEISWRQQAESRALQLARTDLLTGLLNRYASEELLEQLMARSRSDALPVSILLIDIDHFKKVNDQYGHHTGDRVLKAFSDFTSGCLREGDQLVRWGGEEFLIILPDTPLGSAQALAERWCQQVADAKFDELPSITISIGVAQYRSPEVFSRWYESADQALYRAKQAGRNRAYSAIH